MTPDISVIIPAYNAEKTIRPALRSALNQTITDIEVIVINDGSTDRTLERLAPVDDPRLSIYSHPNGGVCAARNKGLEKATGKHIAFLDADDCWAPDKLACQLNALARHPEADVAYSQAKAVDSQGRDLFCFPFCRASGNVHTRLMETCFIVSGSNILIRRECVARSGAYNTSLLCFGDWEYFLRLARRHRFAAVFDYHIDYRYAKRTLSADIRQMEKDGLDVVAAQIEPRFPDRAAIATAFVLRHIAFVALFRRAGPGRCGLALQYLTKAARHYPASVPSVANLRLLAAAALVTCLPGRASDDCSRWLLKTYGRLAAKHTSL